MGGGCSVVNSGEPQSPSEGSTGSDLGKRLPVCQIQGKTGSGKIYKEEEGKEIYIPDKISDRIEQPPAYSVTPGAGDSGEFFYFVHQ